MKISVFATLAAMPLQARVRQDVTRFFEGKRPENLTFISASYFGKHFVYVLKSGG